MLLKMELIYTKLQMFLHVVLNYLYSNSYNDIHVCLRNLFSLLTRKIKYLYS